MLATPDVHTSGNIFAGARRRFRPSISSSCVSVPASKNFSISGSSASATISISASRAGVGGVGHVGRAPAPLGHLARAVGRERVGLHRHEIDDAAEVLLFADRQLDRDDGAAARLPQRFERALERRALAVEAVDDDQCAAVALLAAVPRLLGLHFDAGDGIDDDRARASATRIAARASLKKLPKPGVSMRLILVLFHSA